MTRRWTTFVLLVLLAGASPAQDTEVLETEEARLSYALGMSYSRQLRDQSMKVDPEFYIQGFRDALGGNRTLLNEDEADAILNGLKGRQRWEKTKNPLVSKQDGEAFLDENRAREGIVTLASGLQYEVLRAGHGDKPSIDDTVVVHYRGTLVDGTEFDSSYRRGRPATFAVNRVIRGWTEALQRMPVGSKWKLFVPPALAYGKRGAGSQIAPDATLVFEVELIAVKNAPAVAARKSTISDEAVVPGKLRDIQVSFKLDPRLTRGLYMGDRWVSPSIFSGAPQAGTEYTAEVRAHGVDAGGRRIPLSPDWIQSDSDMVVLSPATGDAIKLTVKRAGESMVNVAANGISKRLLINATSDGSAIRVQISQ